MIGLINKLHDVWLKSKNEVTASTLLKEMETQSSVIEELIKYTFYHFETEEKYMVKYHYSKYESHKREHENLASQVNAIKRNFDSGKEIKSIDIIKFLTEWLRNHILETDKKYGPYFNKKGLS